MTSESITRLRIVFIVWCSLLFSLYVYLCVPSLSVSIAFCLINAFIVCFACVGIRAQISLFIFPNIIFKSLMVMVLLFIACISLDAIHMKVRNEMRKSKANQTEQIVDNWIDEKMSESPFLRSLITTQADPFFVVWLMCFVLLLCAEIRLCFAVAYKNLGPRAGNGGDHSTSPMEIVTIKQAPPPSYSHCIRRDSQVSTKQTDSDDLPTYEEANEIVKRRMSLVSGDVPCSSRSGSIYTSTALMKIPPPPATLHL
ncbi:unnamed protein product, partial [Mesorhabditis belari]|uniref:Uncharacterized protein n=1 Tax=Mesorhabditis belari TaxID=2138241 RepID=A0AAF3FG81_9BILA